jgi:hypothetical protein
MVIFDWRRCPAQLVPPPGPADYGPLAADIGTRTFGDWAPSPDVYLEDCPGISMTEGLAPFAIGGVLAWVLLRKGK